MRCIRNSDFSKSRAQDFVGDAAVLRDVEGRANDASGEVGGGELLGVCEVGEEGVC